MTIKSTIPGFFIVGAAKAGTTSLHHYLDHHPDIYFSPIKEPNFFSTDIDTNNFSPHYRKNNLVEAGNYFKNKPLKKIHLAFVKKEEQYLQLFEGAENAKAIGECSTSYLYSKSAAKNIYQFNPGAKIIAILRNPVERAFSHYLMALKYGYTQLPFAEAFEKDRRAQPKGWGISELFYELGCYHEQLEHYFAVFPKNQLLVLLSGELNKYPDKVLLRVSQFLGLNDFDFDFEKKKQNKAEIPRYSFISRLTHHPVGKALKKILPKTFQTTLKQGIYQSPEEAGIVMKPEDKEHLLSLYKEDIEKTGKLTGLDLSGWQA